MARSHTPLSSTDGDGSCLYCSMSQGLYGTSEHYLQLRLMTALEMLEHREYYDCECSICTQQLQVDVFPTLYSETYDILVRAAMLTVGEESWGHLLHIYALSAALQIPLKSYCPPSTNMSLIPLNRIVYGRGVSMSNAAATTVMWTNTFHPGMSQTFQPSFFGFFKHAFN